MNQKASRQLLFGVTVVFVVLLLLLIMASLLGIAINAILLFFGGVFWLLMLADCLQRKENNFPISGYHEKLIWVITLVFLNIVGAILYFALVLMSGENKTEFVEPSH